LSFTVRRSQVRAAFVLTAALATSALACHHSGALAPGRTGGAAGAAGTPGPNDGGGLAGPIPDGGADAGDGPASDGGAAAFDPGSVGIRRLSDAEYARTLRDLLGLPGAPASLIPDFPGRDDQGGGGLDVFDNLAGPTTPAAPVNETRIEVYFQTAVVLVRQAMTSDTLRARIVTCAPANANDDGCAFDIVRAFGLRAWRRPLSNQEIADLVDLVRADLTAGDDFASAIQQALVAMLVSESFLYRIEQDPPAPDASVHPVGSYELATRLAYLVWSSTPDDALLTLAAAQELQKPDVLEAQVSRLLADPRAEGFVTNFFGQWLGFRVLDGTTLDRKGIWSATLQASAAQEARLFFTELVQGNAPIEALLTSDVNYVDALLANVYGLPPQAQVGTLTRVVVPDDQRKGFLGLAAFLAVRSERPEMSRFPRGVAIDAALLCTQVPAPSPIVPTMDPALTGTPHDQYLMLASQPDCAECHVQFEPLGLGLESFDEIGQFRTIYPGSGAPVDASGALPDKTPFSGLLALADLLAKDQRVRDCARREALVYALGRALTAADADRLAAIDARWAGAGHTVRGLLAAIVTDDLFRTRRGETPP
jgi:hypothetical protein